VSGEPSRPERTPGAARIPREETPMCDICGSTDTRWMMCKLVCQRCRTILMSCEDV
jgi:hypothetical protein